ncbi:MAG: hypothetical protein BWY63_00849 [Chloroflexi bacterium ADurb.Bin360]|nr:MAG: hypothetical protein BWY63_00849 [Chloroflexi bacterium ADurb.Bin360]
MFGRQHALVQTRLSLGASLRREDETHPTARHPTKHPETPKVSAKRRLSLLDEALCVEIRGPGNDGAERTKEVLCGRLPNALNIPRLEQSYNLVENAVSFLASAPFRLGAQQILLRDHLQYRTHILRHAAMHKHQTLLQALPRRGIDFVKIQDVMSRQQPPPAHAEFRVIWTGELARDEFHAGPNAPRILPTTPRTGKPFTQNRPRRYQAPLVFLKRTGERASLPGCPHADCNQTRQQACGYR